MMCYYKVFLKQMVTCETYMDPRKGSFPRCTRAPGAWRKSRGVGFPRVAGEKHLEEKGRARTDVLANVILAPSEGYSLLSMAY